MCASPYSLNLNPKSIPYDSEADLLSGPELDIMEMEIKKKDTQPGCRVLRSNSTSVDEVGKEIPDELTIEKKLEIIHEEETSNSELLRQLPMDMIETKALHRQIKKLPKKRKMVEGDVMNVGVMSINVNLKEQITEVSRVISMQTMT